VASAELDGRRVDAAAIPIGDDGLTHRVRIVLGTGIDTPQGLATPQAAVVTTP